MTTAIRSILLLILALPVVVEAQEGRRGTKAESAKTLVLGILLFPDFEMLDAAGPMEVWGNMNQQVNVITVAAKQEAVESAQGPKILADHSFETCPKLDLLLVPGGLGVLKILKHQPTLDWLRDQSAGAQIAMSVCNGASLLAAAGLLDGRKATTNKAYWDLATSPGPKVNWIRNAR